MVRLINGADKQHTWDIPVIKIITIVHFFYTVFYCFSGKLFARQLQLDNPDRYTGHWCRPTSLSLGADKGMNAAQEQTVDQHKSAVMPFLRHYPDADTLYDSILAFQLRIKAYQCH